MRICVEGNRVLGPRSRRDRKTPNAAVSKPPYTIEEFCAAERMSRSMLYKAWAQGWGPDCYRISMTRAPVTALDSRGSVNAKLKLPRSVTEEQGND